MGIQVAERFPDRAMQVNSQRIAIIGGGVSGLAIGWRLAQSGCSVDVFDQSSAGGAASWAAAGMLAAGVEAEPSEQGLLALTRYSQTLWPEFAHELEACSGLDVGYRDEGTLVTAWTGDELERLRSDYAFQRELGVELEWLTGAEVRRREPYLRSGIAGAVFSPHDHQVDNRKVVPALQNAFTSAGGRLHEQTPVTRIQISTDRVVGVELGDREFPADIVVLAAGAWSRLVPGLPQELLPPVRPLKGQMLALQMDPDRPLLRHVLWFNHAYLVPRREGRLVIGATVEEKGFDTTVTAGGIYGLLEVAWRVLPAIEELPLIETWAGLRPTSRDDAPILGPTPVEGLIMATGHHRNGILLAPVTAAVVSQYVLTGALLPVAQDFTLDRFSHQSFASRTGGRIDATEPMEVTR